MLLYTVKNKSERLKGRPSTDACLHLQVAHPVFRGVSRRRSSTNDFSNGLTAAKSLVAAFAVPRDCGVAWRRPLMSSIDWTDELRSFP